MRLNTLKPGKGDSDLNRKPVGKETMKGTLKEGDAPVKKGRPDNELPRKPAPKDSDADTKKPRDGDPPLKVAPPSGLQHAGNYRLQPDRQSKSTPPPAKKGCELPKIMIDAA